MMAFSKEDDYNQEVDFSSFSQFGLSGKKMTKLLTKAKTELLNCFNELDPKKDVDKTPFLF